MVLRRRTKRGSTHIIRGVSNKGDAAYAVLKRASFDQVLKLRDTLEGKSQKKKSNNKPPKYSGPKKSEIDLETKKLLSEVLKKKMRFKSATILSRYLVEKGASMGSARRVVAELIKSRKLDPSEVFTDKGSIASIKREYKL